jgi:hypothetical protein
MNRRDSLKLLTAAALASGGVRTFAAERTPPLTPPEEELYCNEPLDSGKGQGNRDAIAADALRGFWLIRPDGSLGHSGKYLKSLLDRAGGRRGGSICRATGRGIVGVLRAGERRRCPISGVPLRES